ncbi:hypothetical protein HWI79_1690 [Cryptosporidium felis]|nr:hypothetical protein HWI79_1690 [Cryptosporidium felis]
MEEFYAHSPGVNEAKRVGQNLRKSAPPAIRVIPRINKRFLRPPFTAEQIEKMSLNFINPYKQIFRDAVLAYTERKIKSKRKCELFRNIILGRENGYFNNLKKCVVYDTNWTKEKCKQEKDRIVDLTDQETKSVIDIYLLRSVVNEKIIKQRELLLRLKEFWSCYPKQIIAKIDLEKHNLLERLKSLDRASLDRPKNLDYNQIGCANTEVLAVKKDHSLDQYEQFKLLSTGYEVTAKKFSVMTENLIQRIDNILAAERRLNNVARAVILNSDK